jgi:hypothetical protein
MTKIVKRTKRTPSTRDDYGAKMFQALQARKDKRRRVLKKAKKKR